MTCPSCPAGASTLVVIERQGIEIDYCPQCRGVWLDRGELDKLLEQSAPRRDDRDRDEYRGEARRRDDDRRRYQDDDDDDDRHRSRNHDPRDPRGPEKPRRRREGILGELFDF